MGGAKPLSRAQQSLWFLQALYPDDASANEQFLLDLHGPLQLARLGQAWQRLGEMHPALRSCLGSGPDGPFQQQLPATVPLPHPMDLGGAGDPAQALADLATVAVNKVLDLSGGIPLDLRLCRLSDQHHVLIVTVHHLLADGLSVTVIRDDLAHLYATAPADVDAVHLHSGDCAGLADEAVDAEGDKRAREYWRRQLEGLPAQPLRPLRRQADTSQRSASRRAFSIPPALGDALRELARARGCTLFMALLASWRLLLCRLADAGDVPVGTPMTLRDRPELRRVVGCLVNLAALRTRIDFSSSFEALLSDERETVLGAVAHRALPFSEVVAELAPERRYREHPLVQVLFAFDSLPGDAPVTAPLRIASRTLPLRRQSWWDLECTLADAGPGQAVSGYIAWNEGLYDEAVMSALPGCWLTLLQAIASDPSMRLGDLPLLDPACEARLAAWNATDAPYPAMSLDHWVLEQVARSPDSLAIIDGHERLSYADLALESRMLAARLVAAGLGPGDRVGIALPRSARLVTSMLAVLRSGAVIVPLDPGYPPDRLTHILQDADPRLLLTDAATRRRLPSGGRPWLLVDDPAPAPAAALPERPAAATDIAWILYTSGSTGLPKGAPGTHRSAVNRLHWMWERWGYGPGDRFALRTSPNFIDAYWEIFGALVHGIPLVVIPDEHASDPAALAGALARERVTQLVLVPSLLEGLLDDMPDLARQLASLRVCITSGEPLQPALARRFRDTLGSALLLNTYGTSEIWDATCAEVSELPADVARVPIGRPVANVRVHVLDSRGRALPPGVPGELHVGGVGVGPGYWRQPALTAARYLDTLPGSCEGGPYYRTGDLARWLPDGSLECLGRRDRQLKLRGLRIEPAEIEQVLESCPEIARAVVQLQPESGVNPRLAAWLVPAEGRSIDHDALRAHASRRLPSAMLPELWAECASLPLTPSGKIDRLRLPRIDPSPAPDFAGTPPRPGLEQQIALLWAELLGLPAVQREDNFFAMGGHSLLAIRLMSRLRDRLGIESGLRELYSAPDLAAFASLLAEAQPADGRGRGPRRLAGAGAAQLSFAQQRLWFLDQLDPGSPAWNIASLLCLEGPLNPGALQVALDVLVGRHESLRCRFPERAGEPVLVVEPELSLALEQVEAAGDPQARAAQLAQLARRSFDLASGPLLRVTLLREGPLRHWLLLVIHHIVSDASSNRLLFAELARLYEASCTAVPAALPGLELRYTDFAAWQRQQLAGQSLEPLVDWWQARLAGAPALLDLPTDFPRPAEQDYAGAWHERSLDPGLAARVREFARRSRTTTFVVLLAAFKALLHRLSGQPDLLVGTPVEGRTEQGLEPLVGLFINTIVLRTGLGDTPSFSQLVERIGGQLVSAQQHQALPFEQLVERLAPERALSHAPVFQVLFNLVRTGERERVAAGLKFRLDRLVDHGVSAFDLALSVAEHDAGFELQFEYATSLFRPVTIQRWADALIALLSHALEEPGLPVTRLDIGALAPAGDGGPLPGQLPAVTALFERVVQAQPHALAVTAADGVLDYGALHRASGRLAAQLAGTGIGPGDRVAICLPRGCRYIVAVLGILRSGASYVPLDAALPAARLASLLAQSAARMLVGEAPVSNQHVVEINVDALLADRPGEEAARPPPSLEPDAEAYALFTSGSTGAPRAVSVSHANLSAVAAAWSRVYQLSPQDVHLQMAAAGFDVFTGDWVRALTTGGHLVICPREELLDPPRLLARIATEAVSVAEFVPAVIRLLLPELAERDPRLGRLRLAIVGSDLWYGHEYLALREHCAPGARVINSYGLAECTIDSCWFEGEPDPAAPLPAGRPFPGTRCYVLDAHGGLVPVGVVGELWIGGSGVALGYAGREDLTAERFVADPYAEEPGARMYRTGDRARWRSDGELELLGRVDDQVKLR
ncbi:MAG: amino acid adenylation domain-containing protein, partial [Chromatiales bacterium]|nr:amino acid adenylation domain-containing protein [Chromatiales bacterium]